MSILSVQNLTFTYEDYDAKTGESHPAREACLKDLSFEVEEGSFVLISGDTGSGKSTLLRVIKEEIVPSGMTEGQIAILFQNPKDQCVTDKVWHELAFGMENEGLAQKVMERRIAETATFFDLEKLLSRNTAELSGGELQLVNLCALMTKHPKVLLLDEPTAQLDPAAEVRFLGMLKRIHEELGLTILMVEHNLSEALPLASHLLILDDGRITAYGKKEEVLAADQKEKIIKAQLPIAIEVARNYGKLPISIQEGRAFLKENKIQIGKKANTAQNQKSDKESRGKPSLSLKDIWFRYSKAGADVLRGLDGSFFPGKCYAILGGNGAGKSTLLRILAGLEKPAEGKIKVAEKTALLPQNPETLFLTDSLKGEAKSMGKTFEDLPDSLKKYGEDTHPYDLSGGEKEELALWKVFASGAHILLLDEPQKGLDPEHRHRLCQLLAQRKEAGDTLIMITHDTDFAAECADECLMLSGGHLSRPEEAESFFAQNYYFTTPTARLTRDILPGFVRREDLLKALN